MVYCDGSPRPIRLGDRSFARSAREDENTHLQKGGATKHIRAEVTKGRPHRCIAPVCIRVFTGPEDQASAMDMITEAAVAYDKTSPASFGLGAFEGATMTPLVFKEQLRR